MAQSSEIKLNKRFDQNIEITGTLTVGGNSVLTSIPSEYLTQTEGDTRYLQSFDITTQTDSKYLRSNANDTFTGNLTTGADNHITFGPNTTWGSSLRVGGNGRTATGTEMASVVTTDGNLHLDAANNNNGVYLNFYAGTNGTYFGDGAGNVVARLRSNGQLYKGTGTGIPYWHADNDGPGSGLNADLLDNLQATDFFTKDSDLVFSRASTRKIIFNSDVNYNSDKAFLYFNENSSNHRSGSENVRFSIGAFNDFSNSTVHSDAVDIQGGARLFLNAGSWDSELNSAIGTPGTGAYLDSEPIQFAINNTKIASIDTSGILVGSNRVIHAGNIGSQSVNYANTAGTATSAGNANTLDNLNSTDFVRIGEPVFPSDTSDNTTGPIEFIRASGSGWDDYIIKHGPTKGMFSKKGVGWHNHTDSSFHIMSSGWVSNFGVNSDGTTISRSSSRAPVFYDSNNTSYYIDAASTSNLNNLRINTLNGQDTWEGTITINGDANTYYPVGWYGGEQNQIVEIEIYRNYTETAPSTWNTSTHKGGLVCKIRTNFGGWGGSSYDWKLEDFRETYTTMVAWAGHLANFRGFAVKLRGGGALYHVRIKGRSTAPTVTLGTWDPGNNSTGTSATTTVDSVLLGRKNHIRGNYLYSYDSVVLHEGSTSQTKSGTLQSTVDFRAPIFYDRNNTGYYLHPDSTSVLNGLNVNGYADFQGDAAIGGGSGYGYLKGYTSNWNHFICVRGSVSGAKASPTISGAHQTTFIEYAENNSTTGWFFKSSSSTNYEEVGKITRDFAQFPQVRGSIFYDSDNTNYYVNPNSSSNLYGDVNLVNGNLKINKGHSDTRVQLFYNNGSGDTNDAQMLLWASEPGISYSGVGIGANIAFGGQYYGRYSTLADYGVYMRLRPHDGVISFSHTQGTPNTSGASRTENFFINTSGNTQSRSSSRAPIFYDSNDTTYYCNPNSDSLFKQLRCDTASAGWSAMFGAYDVSRIQNDGARHSLVINAAYYPHLYLNATTANTNDNHGPVISMTGNISGGGFRRWSMGIPNLNPSMFTIGTYDNQQNPHYGCGGNVLGENTWGAKLWLDSSSNLQTEGSMRTPIFYDSNNTSYYTNPAGESILKRVRCGTGTSDNNGTVSLSLNDGSLHFRAVTDTNHKMWYYDGVNISTNPSHGHIRFWADSTQRNASTGGSYLRFDVDCQNATATVHGTFYSTGDIVAYSSDARLKENVRPIEKPLDKLKNIRGVIYDWKDVIDKYDFRPRNRKDDIGVIAQEVEAVMPQVVTLAPFDIEMDDEKEVAISKSGENYKTVQYEKLVPLLIEAIKELSNKVEELENKLNGTEL